MKALSTSQQVGILLGLITLIGLILRIPPLNDSLLADEISSYYVIRGRSLGGMLDMVKAEQETTPPLYFLTGWMTIKLGDPSFTLRLPSMIAGLATIPLTYVLGAWTIGRKAGMLAALLIAVSPFMITYSTEARPYAMFTCLLLLSTLCLIVAVRGGSLRWWIGFALFVAAAMYTHYTAILVLAGQFIWAFAYYKEYRVRLLIAVAGAAILFLPWLPEYLADSDSLGAGVIEMLQPFGWEAIRFDLMHWAVLNPAVPGDVLPGWTVGAALIAGLALALGALGRDLWQRREQKDFWRPNRWVVLVVALALSSPVIGAIISYVDVSIYLPRNLAGSWPGLAVSIGALVMATRIKAVRVVSATLVVFFYAFVAIAMFQDQYQRTDYKSAAEAISTGSRPGDRVVEYVTRQPSPYSPLDVPLEGLRADDPEIPDVDRIGAPARSLLDAAAVPGGVGRFTKQPVEPEATVAKRVGNLTGNEKLFLVTPGGWTEESMLYFPDSPVAKFVDALPDGVEHVKTQVFPGMPYTVSLVTFEKQPD